MPELDRFDVVVVGAGPAGLAAANAAAGFGARVALIDENELPGGQIYRASQGSISASVREVIEDLSKKSVVRFDGSTVFEAPSDGVLRLWGPRGTQDIGYRSLVLAVGGRELFLPFPGWTLPNAMGIGGLQALVKAGLDVREKRVVVAGTGPLLLAVGAYLLEHGARVPIILEQAPLKDLALFGAGLVRYPAKIGQGISLGRHIATRLRAGAWVERAEGSRAVESVTWRKGGKSFQTECDFLACAYGFVPNVELPQLLGCEIQDGFVKVDDQQLTSVKGVFCAGEPTGIGGVDLSQVEGRIAGLVAIGQDDQAEALFGKRESWKRFARSMDRAFALRHELMELSTPDTIVCRCEDVRAGDLVAWESSRTAKLQTRCGMGPCQGRICGPATQKLFGWTQGSVRPPLSPVPLSALGRPLDEIEN